MSINRLRSKFIQKDDKGFLYCYKCKKFLHSDNFNNHDKSWYRDYKITRCKSCVELQRKRRIELDHKRINLDRILISRWLSLKTRASRKRLELDFNWEYLKELWHNQNGKCAISGIDMTYYMFKGRIPTNISVDRIDGAKGYVKTNIQLVCMAVNQMKSDLSLDTLLYFCKQILINNE